MNRTVINDSSGIYAIRSKIDGRQYIGSAVNLKRRKYVHFLSLKKGNHCNTYLQNYINKNGADAVQFVILELCDKKS